MTTEYIIQTPRIHCKIEVDEKNIITGTEIQLQSFLNHPLDMLCSWMYKVDPNYKIYRQGNLFEHE